MYKIIYKKHGSNEEQCMGSSTDFEHAVEEMDKLEAGPLGKTGSFRLFREGTKEKRCKECRASCTGAGKAGNGNQCSYYTAEERKDEDFLLVEGKGLSEPEKERLVALVRLFNRKRRHEQKPRLTYRIKIGHHLIKSSTASIVS